MEYTVKAWYDENDKRTGWAVWYKGDFVVDIFPTKKQAVQWINKANVV